MFGRIRAWLGSWAGPAPEGDLGSLDVRNGLDRRLPPEADRPFGECPPLTPLQARSIAAGSTDQDAAFLRDLGLEAGIDPATGRVRFARPVPVDDPIGFVPTQPPRGATTGTQGTPPPGVPAAPRGPFPDWDETAVEAGFLGIRPDDPTATITPADLAWLASQRDGGAR